MRRILTHLIISLSLFFSLHPACVCAADPTTAEEPVIFNFHDVDIRAVIKSVAKLTGKNFIIDPKVKGKVTIVSTQSMSEDDLYGVFLSALQVHGFTAVETGNVIKIIPYTRAKQEMTNAYVEEKSPRRPGDRSITRLYKLKHVPADKLVAVLRPLISPQSYLAAHQESNMLIMSDRAANIDRLLRIIQRIDHAKTGEIEIIRLEHADARDVATVIEGLEIKSAKKVPEEELRLIADDRTNSILLSGAGYRLLRAKTLITHLDTPIETEGATQVIFLRFAKAKDLVPILSGISAENAKRSSAKKQKTDVTIQADENTNALIITAPAAVMKSLQSVIRKLDIQRVQVVIEAIIAEVRTDRGAELGIQWQSTDEISEDGHGAIGGTSFSSPNNPGVGIKEIMVDPLLAGSGLNIGFFRGTTEILGTEILNLGGLLSALATATDTNILSTPTLVTLDNEEAEIIVGQNVPFPTGSFTSTGNTTPDNPFTTFERHDVGVKLKVTPQINEGNIIRLDIIQEVSNLTAVVTDGGPITNQRTIKTSVMVENGKILVLGGLISDDVQETVQKVPFFGSIPLLGALFRFKSTTHDKQNLMVFLRPVILRDETTRSRITFDKYDYIRRLQQESDAGGVSLMPKDQAPVLKEFQEYEEPTDAQ